jgi:hypothetical protein
MSNNLREILREVERIARTAQIEFDDLADYMWKSVRLIEHETRLELRKLKAYFPDDHELQELRWEHESRKLRSTFPFLISQGNLLTATTLLEIYILLLAKTVEGVAPRKLADVRGQGVNRLLEFFETLGVAPRNIPHWEQVSAALSIRNCAVHAGGALSYSREGSQLRNIVRNHRFLTPEIRELRREHGLDKDDVTLIRHPVLGERVVITNEYAHWIASLLRDYFLDLCSATATRLAEASGEDANRSV